MELKNYFDFIGADTENIWDSRAIRIKGHRIGIEHVLAYYQQGYTPDEIAKEFPGLSLEKIYATITFYLHYQSKVNAYLGQLKARREQDYALWAAHPPTLVQRLREAQASYPEEHNESTLSA